MARWLYPPPGHETIALPLGFCGRKASIRDFPSAELASVKRRAVCPYVEEEKSKATDKNINVLNLIVVSFAWM